MFGNLIWLALTNIKRRKLGSILFFAMAFFISHSIFLINLSNNFLKLPEFIEIRTFFHTVTISALVLSVLLLVALSFMFLNSRKQELGIMRIYGARKADILLLTSLEIFFLSFSGAVLGIFSIILLISFRVLYIPHFFREMERLKLLKLIGIGGQTVFLVILIEITISLLLLSFLLHTDIKDLARG